MDPGEITVLANADSGGRRAADRVEAALRAAGMDTPVVRLPPDALTAALEAAAARGGVLAVAGGDGTLRAAAGIVGSRGATLVPLPAGTLNHFCTRLGITSAEDGVAALLRGRTRQVALGLVDDRVFLNTATVGFYAATVRRRERLRRWMGRWPAATAALGRDLLAGVDAMALELDVDGRTLRRRASLLWVGLGRGSFPFVAEGGEAAVAPLELALLGPGGRRPLLRALRWLSRRALTPSRAGVPPPELMVMDARRLLVRAPERLGVTLDGEVFECRAPALCAVADGALRVRVP